MVERKETKVETKATKNDLFVSMFPAVGFRFVSCLTRETALRFPARFHSVSVGFWFPRLYVGNGKRRINLAVSNA